MLPVLLCPFSPLSENILIAIDGASGRRPAKHPIPGPMAVRLGLFAREPIGGAGLPHRSYVGVASGLLKDSNSALPIGHGGTRLGGSTCRPHEVGQGPQWELGNVEIADISLTKFCVSRKCSRGKVPELGARGRPNKGVERDLETRDDPLFILDLIRRRREGWKPEAETSAAVCFQSIGSRPRRTRTTKLLLLANILQSLLEHRSNPQQLPI